ncbi:uncharacterized protein MYCFIDRAFT_153940 [Pseudocercospora fijiensis CIRAD86]|uniref:DUF1365-domain-containing protein n=1 Tax=Pseudocercospora fijiensis (strain CIRAD86) TaxID=383855 RepID=M3B1V4_PSEFD|nr:uncharacterized protein MYCFIDRAFT_153940 [Pseudocercospora fijiensis CIRAD86]EME83343.1 hypothetical protein MYCFIDRAFT_153940 [Pseudocercospora fijiensis CIRAD86]
MVRIVRRDLTWVQDLALFLALHNAYGLFCTRSWSLPSLQALDLRDETLLLYFQVFALLGICGGFAGSIVLRGHHLKSKDKEEEEPVREQRIEESLLPPLLIPSRTTHSRLFPRKHSFSYTYLLVGVPVGLQGRVANVLSIDSQRPAWFDVRSADFLNRGSPELGLGEKLKRFLHAQRVTDRDYAFAYLVTAPRFLGYSFNPVSFWYLYDSDTRLKYMILEVNNTFGERRMYLLKTEPSTGGDSARSFTFSDEWAKDFHVSPFNSRKGSYSLQAVDPLAAFEQKGHVEINNTIVLRSSGEHAKIVARVWSEGMPEEPSNVTTIELARFILAWWWVGLATFPRIVWEAQKLFFKRKLHVWYRPEVTEASIGRDFTKEETILEQFFRSFLTSAVENGDKPLRVIYEAPHNSGEEIVLYSPGFTYEEDHSTTMTLKVLSPAFYSRFIHYAHAAEAFDRECLGTDDKNRTIVIDGAQGLPTLLDCMKHTDRHKAKSTRRKGVLHDLRWNILRRLRCPPAVASYPTDESRLDVEYSTHDSRSFKFSECDRFIQTAHKDSSLYWKTVVKLFIAERITFGIPLLVAVFDWTVRITMILSAMIYCDNFPVWDILRARPFHKSDIPTSSIALVLANSVHIWSSLKG